MRVTIKSTTTAPSGRSDLTYLFAVGTALMTLATMVVIPALDDGGWDPVLAWFVSAGALVFVPLIGLALRELRLEEPAVRWTDRLRLVGFDRSTTRRTVIGFVVVGIGSAALAFGLEALGYNLTPSYLDGGSEGEGASRAIILTAWVPFFLLNIVGEEFVWRGVVLPRQEERWGDRAWMVHAAGWGIFHIPIGLTVMLTAVPFYLVISYVCSRSRNTWPGVLIHALVNGPAFVAVQYGLVG